MKNDVYISLGSNLGDREQNIENAYLLINNEIGEILKKSQLYESNPKGYTSENKYLNSVIKCKTTLDIEEIIQKLLQIEQELGRKRTAAGYSDRTIDLDFLLYNTIDFCYKSKDLELPHPRMFTRDFVLVPLLEIADNSLKNALENILRNKTKRESDENLVLYSN